jgi:molybdopterin converting factor small subunit
VTGAVKTVRVEFFGPFRKYGSVLDLEVQGELKFGELLSRIAGEVGADFEKKASSSNTTFIVDDKIVDRKKLDDTRVRPGDKVAFALLLGGG